MKDSNPRRQRRWWQFSLRGLFVFVTLCAIVLGVGLYVQHELAWQRKKEIAERWAVVAVEQEAKPYSPFLMDLSINPNPLVCPEPLEVPEQLEVLRIGMTSLRETADRLHCVKLLVKLFPQETHGMLRRVVVARNRPELRALVLHLLSLFRKPEDVDLVLPLLNDRAAEVRAAAADCLGIIHRPSYEIPWRIFVRTASPETDVPVDIRELIAGIPSDNEVDVRADVRSALVRMMTEGETSGEREAAARAVVAWPPQDYKLRLAEWGVWLDDGGELKLVRSVIDEIPEFVHRTHNSAASFRDRVIVGWFVTKPIIHLTADRPLAIDIEVGLRWGRPWFAYPRPDDFTVQVEWHSATEPRLATFDRPDAAKLEPFVQGFPWIRPGERDGLPPSRPIYGGLHGLGLRWQSAIVSPRRLSWMTLPELDDDERFAWWSALRQVPSSWVSSQGETERFFYYDGPTLAKAPLRLGYDGRVLSWCQREMFGRLEDEADGGSFDTKANRDGSPPTPGPETKKQGRLGFLVQVNGDQVSARRFSFTAKSGNAVIENVKPIEGHAAIDAFTHMLTDYGLTPEEAGGLLRAWEKWLFHTDGTRLITVLLRADYDRLCPLTVRPAPTETVRLGLLLSEFSSVTEPDPN